MNMDTSSPGRHEEIDLSVYWQAIRTGRWLLAGVFLSVIFLALVYLFLAPRIYQADVLLQFDINEKKISTLEDISGQLGSKSEQILAEIEILKSRSVLGAVIDRLHLQNSATPVYFPVIGKTLSRYYRKVAERENGVTTPPLWGLSGFAWGGEEIEVSILHIPEHYREEEFRIMVGQNGRYQMMAEDGSLILTGTTGALENSGGDENQSRSRVEIQIDQLVARPGTEFKLKKRPFVATVVELQKKVSAAENVKQSGVVQLTMTGADSKLNAQIVNTIAEVYTQQNISWKREEISNMLVFINDQLPALQESLENAEAMLNLQYEKFGTVNIELETHTLLSQLTDIEKRITSLELALVQYEYQYTKKNPYLIALEKQQAQLAAERDAINQRLAQLPFAEMSVVKHLRDVQIATDIHSLLAKKAQELEIAKAGIISSAHIVDKAIISTEPVKPNKRLVLAASAFLGLFLGVFVILLRKLVYGVVDSEKMVLERFDVPVLASLPHSTNQQRIDSITVGDASVFHSLASDYVDDPVTEGLRSFRTNLQFSKFRDRKTVLVVTSPGPEAGKAFFATNFAYLLARAGSRVLLIDGDLRNGKMHGLLSRQQSPGLTEILKNGASPGEAIQRISCNENSGFDFLASGKGGSNAPELLLQESGQKLFMALREDYDAVIIKAPSISIAPADAALYGHLTDALNLLIVRAGQQTLADIESSLHSFMKSSAKISGIVINDLAVA